MSIEDTTLTLTLSLVSRPSGPTTSVGKVDASVGQLSSGVVWNTPCAMRLCFRLGLSDPVLTLVVSAQSLPFPNLPLLESMEPHPAPAPLPEAEAHCSWLLRIQKNAARIQKRRTLYLQARRRRRIPKSTLVGTLFSALDTHNNGALGRDELNKFALLTGYQGERDDLFVEITHLLDNWGFSSTQSTGPSGCRTSHRLSRARVSSICPRQNSEGLCASARHPGSRDRWYIQVKACGAASNA